MELINVQTDVDTLDVKTLEVAGLNIGYLVLGEPLNVEIIKTIFMAVGWIDNDNNQMGDGTNTWGGGGLLYDAN